jgi:hypothetical protein
VISACVPAVLALVLASSTGPGEVHVISVDDVAPLEGKWRFSVGDDPLFASPSYDDSAWALVDVPRGLGEQGYADLLGMYWLRVRVRLPRDASQRELSLRMGSVDTAGEIFVDGERVGGKGRVSLDPTRLEDAHDMHAIVPVPLAATQDGEIVIAVRAVRSALRADAAPARGGVTAGPLWIGKTDDVIRAQVLRDIDKLLTGFTVLIVGLYHLQLFRKRREQRDYFWYGVFCLWMSAYLLSSADTIHWWLGTMLHSRVMWASLILTLPTFLQLLWPLLGRPIRWWWRVNQIAMITYAFITVLWPTQWFVIKFIGWFELLLLMPLMLGTTIVVVVSAWRGNPEARTLLFGTLGLVVAAGNNILLERTSIQMPNLMSYAMGLFVFSIAISLANRFSRVFRELDEKNAELMRMERLADEVRRLNKQVHAKVKDRSDELSKALSRLGRPTPPSTADGIAIGTILDGRFVVERALGAGGMGAVYAGRDLVSNMAVAVKVMKASSVSEVDALHRFLREARAVVAIEHEAIVRMLHVDISGDGLFYQVQELVDGITLEDALRTCTLDAPLVARTGSVLAEALAAAHAAGVIHRDVKPSNIMLTHAVPGVKLLDFGVAKLTTSAAPSDQTGTGRYIGTPAYMAPEQRFIADADVTDRVDVFALGLVLYRALCGALPGRVLDVEERIPAPLRALVDECLREDPAARPTASGLAARLAAVADALGAPPTLTSADAWRALVHVAARSESSGPSAHAPPSAPLAPSQATETQAPTPGGVTDILRELVRPPS